MLFSSDHCRLILHSFFIQLCDHTLEFLCICKLFLRIADRNHMLQILLNKIRQCIIIDQVGICCNLLDINGRACDQSRALCNIAHPLIKLLDLCYLWCTDRIEDLCLSRDHVRSDSAGVCDRAVNSRCIDHMLSHIVHTDIHDLNGIQRGTSKLRRPGRMG